MAGKRRAKLSKEAAEFLPFFVKCGGKAHGAEAWRMMHPKATTRQAQDNSRRIQNQVAFKEAYDKSVKLALKKSQVTVDDVIKQFWFNSSCNTNDAFDDDGVMLPHNKMPESIARSIIDIKRDSFRLEPRSKSTEALAKHLGMLKDTLKIESDDDAKVILAARKRRDESKETDT